MNQGQRLGSTTDLGTEYRRFFQLSPQMLCTIGFDGCIHEVNDCFVTGLEHPVDSVVGRRYDQFIHPEDRDAMAEEMMLLTSGHVLESFENRCRHHDGSYRSVAWSIRADVEHGLLYCALRDVTEKREQAAVVAKLLAELERSNTDLAQFAYVASHDLSEPLRMVSSYVRLLGDRYSGRLDDDADEFIGFAVDGAVRMKALIDDLLAYSRAGGTAVLRRSVDCEAVAQTAASDLDVVIAETGATVVIDHLPIVIGDPGQLSQVFHNLLSNALKFVRPGVAPQVRVSAERRGAAWCFSVEDNGIGVADAHRTRIFLMFKRLHGRAEYPGTGIGLALCHKLVSRFGGSIWFDAAPDGGSIFRFTVPDDAPLEDVA